MHPMTTADFSIGRESSLFFRLRTKFMTSDHVINDPESSCLFPTTLELLFLVDWVDRHHVIGLHELPFKLQLLRAKVFSAIKLLFVESNAVAT